MKNAILRTLAQVARSMDDSSPPNAWSELGQTFLLVCSGVLIGAVGLGFALAGCYALLAQEMEPWLASLLLGLVLLLAGVTTIWLARRKRAEPRGVKAADAASDLGEELGKLLERSGVGPTELSIASLVAGLVFGASPRLRRAAESNGRERRD